MFGLNGAGKTDLATEITGAVLNTVFVGLRIFTKVWYRSGIHSDDYWIIVALIFAWGCNVTSIWGTINGGGGIELKDLVMDLEIKDIEKLEITQNYLLSMFLLSILYACVVFTMKISILCFYRRIFNIKKSSRITSWILIAVSTSWFIATGLASLLNCLPMDIVWHRTKAGKCENLSIMFLLTGIFDVLIDIAILAFPIYMTFTIQLLRRKRFALAGIFSLGGFVVITNIIRLPYGYAPGTSYGIKQSSLSWWSGIHVLSAFLCACLPIYKPLWVSMLKTIRSLLTRHSGTFYKLPGRTSKEPLNSNSYIQMDYARKELSASNMKSLHLENIDLENNSAVYEERSVSIIGGHERASDYYGDGIMYERTVSVV